MIRSMFAAVAGLRTHQNRMDVISNNIANVNTVAYKPGRATFKESIYQTTYTSADGNDVYGGQNPSQIGYGSQISAIATNYAPGSYEPTGYGTDCMINGNGFFIVGPKPTGTDNAGGEGAYQNTPEAISKLKLTRTGEFTIDGDGYLVDANRNVVYGFFTADGEPVPGTGTFKAETTRLMPVRIKATSANNGTNTGGTGTTTDDQSMNVEQIAIDGNGILSGKGAAAADGTEGAMYKFAQIALCNVPNPSALEKMGDSYYQIRNNTGTVHAYTPGQGTTGQLISGGLEMSKADLATEISSMIITERGFQANSKMITVSDEMLQELINMKR